MWVRVKIKGHNTQCEINEKGEIRNIKTKIPIKPFKDKNGYLIVSLFTKGVPGYTRKDRKVHRLVAKAFIPNPDNKPEVNHVDGDKENNHVSNLEWVHHADNMKHAALHNLIKNVKRGEKSSVSKHSDEVIHKVCQMIADGFKNKEIEKILGIKAHNVSLIKHGKCWRHISSLYLDLKPIPLRLFI